MPTRISSWLKKGSKRSTSDSESSDDVLAANVGSIAGDNELLYASPAVMESVKHSKNSANGNNRIEFYSKDLPFFWLNNASPHPVVVDGIRYPTNDVLRSRATEAMQAFFCILGRIRPTTGYDCKTQGTSRSWTARRGSI